MGNCLSCCNAIRTFFSHRSYEELPDDSFQHQPEQNSSDVCQLIAEDESACLQTEAMDTSNVEHDAPGTSSRENENFAICQSELLNTEQKEKVKRLFEEYKHPNERAIFVEGIERFCKDLRIVPNGLDFLIFAFKFNAVQGPCIYEEAFYTACQNMKAYCIEDIREKWPDMHKEVVSNVNHFKKFYEFIYRFHLKLGHTELEKEDAINLWKLVLPGFMQHHYFILDKWIGCLERSPSVVTVCSTTWNKFLDVAAFLKYYWSIRDPRFPPYPEVLNHFLDCQIDGARRYSAIGTFFKQYKDPNEDAILLDGLKKLCIDLGIGPDDFFILLLAWKFNARRKFCLTRDEFVSGCYRMKVYHIQYIRAKIPGVIDEIRTPEKFKDFYRYAFRFGLEPDCTELEAEQAVRLWNLVFSRNKPPILDRWLKFHIRHPQRKISCDTWNVFLHFAESMKDPSFRYDPNAAWPILIDEFMEYEQGNRRVLPSQETQFECD